MSGRKRVGESKRIERAAARAGGALSRDEYETQRRHRRVSAVDDALCEMLGESACVPRALCERLAVRWRCAMERRASANTDQVRT